MIATLKLKEIKKTRVTLYDINLPLRVYTKLNGHWFPKDRIKEVWHDLVRVVDTGNNIVSE